LEVEIFVLFFLWFPIVNSCNFISRKTEIKSESGDFDLMFVGSVE